MLIQNIDLASYNELMNSLNADSYSPLITANDKVTFVEIKNPLFANVFEKGKTIPENLDLPVVSKYYPLSRQIKSRSQTVMRLQSGNPFLTSCSTGKGMTYMVSTSLEPESGNFARHALFVPILLRAALQRSSEIAPPLIIGA